MFKHWIKINSSREKIIENRLNHRKLYKNFYINGKKVKKFDQNSRKKKCRKMGEN